MRDQADHRLKMHTTVVSLTAPNPETQGVQRRLQFSRTTMSVQKKLMIESHHPVSLTVQMILLHLELPQLDQQVIDHLLLLWHLRAVHLHQLLALP